ncbi:MAG: hypothetical protein ACE5KW_03800, partial [Dehalococcoidia bacterium]
MTPSKKAAAQVSTSQWLEAQVEEVKAKIVRLEHRLNEAVREVHSLSSGSRKMDEVIGSLSSSVTSLPALLEELRRVKDQMSRLQDRQSSLNNRSEELIRQRQAELEQEQQERAGLIKRMEALEKSAARYENRWQAIEEALRHLEDEVDTARQGQEQLGRAIHDLNTRTSRSMEEVTRLEGAAGKLANEVENIEH